jgi:hypothetical protein
VGDSRHRQRLALCFNMAFAISMSASTWFHSGLGVHSLVRRSRYPGPVYNVKEKVT